jgi:uroporphyrinogen decarboxylase
VRKFCDSSFASFSGPDSSSLQKAFGEAGSQLSVFDLDGRSKSSQIADFANRILTGDFDIVVFVSGAGTRAIIESALRLVPRQRFLDGISDIKTIAGSVAAANVLRQFDVAISVDASANQTDELLASWRAMLIAIDGQGSVVNQNVAIEKSSDSTGLFSGLESRGARLTPLLPFETGVIKNPSVAIDLFERIDAGEFHGLLFSDPALTAKFIALAGKFGRVRLTKHLLDDHLVITHGTSNEDCSELLRAYGFPVDYQADAPTPNDLVTELADNFQSIQKQKRIIRVNMSGPATSPSDPQAPWYNNPFMKACRGEPTDVTPIWMMRQAGRYMAEYREVRDKVSFLELCANPQLCSEVMCTAVSRLGVDAAIIFSDLLPILVPMGSDLEFVKGDGPVIHNPVRTNEDIDRIKPLESNEPLQFVMDTVRQTRNDLPADMPLIGFSGAPFTLASYMIEGGSSRNYHNTKKIMYGDPAAWQVIMQKLTDSISLYIAGQVEAGAQCIQLFDSWAGCLSYEDYKQYVHPYVKSIIASVPSAVPVINFATGNPALLSLLADTAAAVVGIDWRVRLDRAWETVGHDRAVQGNLDPTVLLTDPKEIRRQAKIVLDQAGGRAGHIFNLGHGILPMTPVDNAIALVDAVHELSAT